MDYIAILDFEHLDNSIFLNAFAQALAQQKNTNGIVIHGDSAYTDRLIQTGIMREDARIRATKGLNHRLIALFADQGVATIGLNGYQRKLIFEQDGNLQVDVSQFNRLPHQPLILLSNLIYTDKQDPPRSLPLSDYALLLKTILKIEEVLVFNLDEKSEFMEMNYPDKIKAEKLESDFVEKFIPEEFRTVPCTFRLTSTRQFAGFPDESGTVLIKK